MWKKLSASNIQLDIHGGWRPIKCHPWVVFIKESFINKGYPVDVLALLNDVRVYMKVVFLSGMVAHQRIKMANWVMGCEVNRHHRWAWSPRASQPAKTSRCGGTVSCASS